MSLLRRADPSEQRFVDHVTAHCREAGVSLRTRPSQTLSKRMWHTGAFDGHDMSLYVARKSRYWFEVLIHEYCHLLQKLDGSWWFTPAAERMWASFEDWMAGLINPSEDRILECTRTIQECELDCERRAIRIMRKHQFPTINLGDYARYANSYVLGHEASRLLRKWHNKRQPYKVRQIAALLPSTLIRESQIGKLPPGFLAAYARYCVL